MTPRGQGPSSLEAVATYLREAIGVGGVFTLAELRANASGATQSDRRMRDLRAMGWIIHSRKDDPTIGMGEYRVVFIGGMVPIPTVSDRVRREVFDRAQNRCQVCGYAAGETYPDGGVVRLQLGHWVPKGQNAEKVDPSNLRAECHRCNEGIRDKKRSVVTTEAVRARVLGLPAKSKKEMAGWIRSQHREPSVPEQAYYDFRQLPPSEQAAILDELERSIGLN
jgi:hypothetical protein